ncbi:MAG: GatB/YqeY domain-containing protein [Anaerolineales bacterium]|nr:GatB/YqeY domain-containing protein [Anaerolineales bacterium]
MLTKQKIEEDLKDAMLARDEVRKRTLRMVLTSVKFAEVERRGQLDEPTLLSLILKEVKSRKESIEEAERAKRDDLISALNAEIDVLQAYLPQPLTHAELKELAQAAIEEVDASGPSDMGKVMKSIMPHVQGRADGKVVSELVRNLLSEI